MESRIASAHEVRLVLEGPPPDAATMDAELLALAGKAGRVVEAVMQMRGSKHVVRVTGWPAAITVSGDSIYVNATWLVVMASLELTPAAPIPASGGGTVNPLVMLAGSTMADCANGAASQCNQCNASDGGTCFSVSLADEPSALGECKFLSVDPARYAQLCALNFLKDPAVSACVAQVPDCALAEPDGGAITSTDLQTAAAFVASSACLNRLDACLGGGGTASVGTAPPPTSTTTGSRGCGGCSGCDCNKCCSDKGCGALGCKSGTGTCGGLCLDGTPKFCSMHREERTASVSPWGIVWIFPFFYLVRLARRRRED